MSLRSPGRIVAALAVLPIAFLSVAAIAGADEADPGYKWDPKNEVVDKVGEKYFVEEDMTETVKTHVVLPGDAPPQDQSQQKVQKTRAVHEVLAVTDGKATKKRVVVEKWDIAAAGAKDTSLQGKTVLVEGAGKDRKASVEGGDAGLSPQAKQWIKQELVDEKETKDILNPKGPVGAGDEWEVDPQVVAEKMFQGAEIDPEKSSVKAKLTKVRVENGVHHGTFELRISLQLKSLPGTPLPWKEGGVISVVFDGERQLDPPGRKADADVTVKMSGVAEQETPQGAATITLEVEASGTDRRGDAAK